MNVPEELLYTRDHEWILAEGDQGTIGITDHAQSQLGDVVFVELPEVGNTFSSGEAFGSVESVKAVSELYCPVSVEVLEVNSKLVDSPEKVNEDPYESGWMIRVRLTHPEELDSLVSAEEYIEYLKKEV